MRLGTTKTEIDRLALLVWSIRRTPTFRHSARRCRRKQMCGVTSEHEQEQLWARATVRICPGDVMEIKEHYLWNFVYWVRLLRARHGDAKLLDADKTLEHVAEVVKRALKGENPLPKKQGRKSDPDTMWLCFHLVCVVPLSSPTTLPRHTQHIEEGRAGKRSVGGFVTVGKSLNISPATVKSHVYKAFEFWKTADGQSQYINWLNRREQKWAAYQASVEKRKSTHYEYVPSALTSSIVCRRSDELGETQVVDLSPRDRDVFEKEATEQMNTSAGHKDYENWSSYRGELLCIREFLVPSTIGRKRK